MSFRSLAALIAACLATASLLHALTAWADETATASISFSEQVQPVFDTHCVVCHQYGAEQAGLSLEDGDAHSNLVNVKSTQSPLERVVPGKIEASYLVHKLRGTHNEVGGSGVLMPLSSGGKGAMSVEENALVTSWIEQGALDN